MPLNQIILEGVLARDGDGLVLVIDSGAVRVILPDCIPVKIEKARIVGHLDAMNSTVMVEHIDYLI